MSTEAQTQTGQSRFVGHDADAAGERREPQMLIRESVKYRRRAQEAERRAEAFEAEIDSLRQARQDREAALQAELDQARAETEALGARLADLERDRSLERELVRAGCADTETALALARERLSDGGPPEDPAAFAKTLLAEKPHLRGAASTGPSPAPSSLPPPTTGAKPAGDRAPHRTAQRLAERARQTGSAGDVMAYMRARRAVGA
ncbi:MAG TPA: hypothetical protein VM238_16725 [Phycisphaerae bacterium]|nr:hypothetical protein [Phycisphaerae bacterium]